MAVVTLNQLIQGLNKTQKEIAQGVPFKFGVFDVTALMHRRIFTDGLGSDGGKIGSYDTKRELYVEDSKLRRSGNHTGKNGKSIKTSYYKNYKTLRGDQGVESSFVNLKFTDELQLDFGNISATGQIPTPVRIDDFRYQIDLRESNSKKFRGNEKRFGKAIGNLTKSEEEQFKKTIEFKLEELYNA